MPHTLSDSETSLLLRHLLRHPADPALVPVIHSLHSSLVTSRTASPYSTTNSGELYSDFLGSEELESPEDFNDWDAPSCPLADPLALDDHYSVDDGNFESAICDYISSCNYGLGELEPAETNDKGILPSLIFQDRTRHSDKAGLAWCKDGNGWKGNNFFSSAE
jgi:hypothetical protein